MKETKDEAVTQTERWLEARCRGREEFEVSEIKELLVQKWAEELGLKEK